MRKIIHNIRQQPEEVRRHLLHLLTIIAALILFLIWVYSLGKNLTSADTSTKFDNDLKPLSALKDNIIGGYQNILKPDPELNLDTQQ